LRSANLGVELLDPKPLASGGRLRRARRRSEPWVGFEWLEEPERTTISVQSGCPVGCLFCDAGTLPYSGNLTLDELRLQAGENPKELRLIRMGEPSFNPAVLALLEESPAKKVLLSTVAPDCPVSERFLEALLELKNRRFPRGRFTLQFSYPSTEPGDRRSLIPVRTWGAEKIAIFGKRWMRPHDARVVLNVPLVKSFEFDPRRAAADFDPAVFSWTFTPVHPSGRARLNGLEQSWQRPPAAVARRMEDLAELGFHVSALPSEDADIAARAACGQLESA